MIEQLSLFQDDIDEENDFLLQDRLAIIKDIVKKYGEDNFSLSFSGGKDSLVLHYLIDMAIPNNNIPRVFVNTGMEYSLMIKFVKELAQNDKRIIMITPKNSMKKILEENGYPFKSKDFSNKVNIYQRKGMLSGLQRYISFKGKLACPNKLRYMFTDENKLKISDKCCKLRKEKPLEDWNVENKRKWTMIALLGDEAGRRNKYGSSCFTTYGKISKFYPLRKVDSRWEEWFINKYSIKLCPLYYPPYNFKRTGCKGCPFAMDIQKVLDTLKEHFPNEYKQCELIWKPVYDEYRRIGYRLKGDKK